MERKSGFGMTMAIYGINWDPFDTEHDGIVVEVYDHDDVALRGRVYQDNWNYIDVPADIEVSWWQAFKAGFWLALPIVANRCWRLKSATKLAMAHA